MNYTMTILMLALLALATACGGGGSGGGGGNGPGPGGGGGAGGGTTSNQLPTSVGTVNGSMIDSPVVGLTYTTGATTAVTGAGGSYTCQAGDDVTFKIGSIVLGKSPCLPVITPVEIATLGAVRAEGVSSFSGGTAAELNATQNNRMIRIAMLLQTMDSDGDTSNGITIAAGAEVILQQILTSEEVTLQEALDSGAPDSDWSLALSTYASMAGGSHSAQTSATGAISHLEATIAAATVCTTADVGNSLTVTGLNPNCVALTCDAGFTVSNGSCISNAAFSIAAVVAQLDSDYTASHSKTFVEAYFGTGALINDCRNTNPSNLYDFSFAGTAQGFMEELLTWIDDRVYNDYTSNPTSPEFAAAIECAESVTKNIMDQLATSNPTLKASLLAEIGAGSDVNFVDAGGTPTSLHADELAILELLITHYGINP